MTKLFVQILQMSISASYVIIAILLARLILKKAPKKYSYALWSVAAFRLLCPYTFESIFSLFNLHLGGKEKPAIDLTGVTAAPGTETIVVDTGIPVVSQTIQQVTNTAPAAPVSETIGETIVSAAQEIAPVQQVISSVDIIAWIWVTGVIALFAYGLISYVKLQRKMRMSMPLRDNIRQAYIRTPFILGFIKPTIYIPFDLEPMVENISISHERCHIHRGDHIVKLLSYLILIIHWFNPLCWLAYFDMGKDMEMSVDEYVLSHYRDISRSYSTALLSFSTGKRFALASPLAFGERNVKERIVNAMKFKNATRFVSVIAAVMCILVLVACGTNGTSVGNTGNDETLSPEPYAEKNLYDPLTGIPVEEIIKPVAMTVNNHRFKISTIDYDTGIVNGEVSILPWGISNADIMIQYEDAAGYTNYIVMSSDVRRITEIGGIVEASSTEIDILRQFDVLYVHKARRVYDRRDTENVFERNSILDLDINQEKELATIKEDFAIVDSAYAYMVKGSDVWQYMEENGLSSYHGTNQFLPFTTPDQKIIFSRKASQVNFIASRTEYVGFEYDPQAEMYYKKDDAIIPTDQTLSECVDLQNGEKVQFDNVILLYVDSERINTGILSMVYNFSSGGEGYYFTKGTYERIYWQKGNENEFVFLDENQNTINVNCGKTYIALIPIGDDPLLPYTLKSKDHPEMTDQTSGLEPLEIIA